MCLGTVSACPKIQRWENQKSEEHTHNNLRKSATLAEHQQEDMSINGNQEKSQKHSSKSQDINEHIQKSKNIYETQRAADEPIVKDLIYPPSPCSLPSN